jgi:hypothetical protein
MDKKANTSNMEQKAATPQELNQVLEDLGIELVSSNHPIYKEPPSVIFTSPPTKATNNSQKK